MILIPGIFFTAYQVSPLFKERVILVLDEIVNYDKNSVSIKQSVSSSTGVRILFSINSWEIIKKNLLFGVGTGDFPKEYKRISKKIVLMDLMLTIHITCIY